MNFETFDKSTAPFFGQPHITIQKRGTITLNAASFAALGSPAAVELLFDADANVLAMRSVEPDVGHAAFVRRSTRAPSGPWVISAMAFVHHYGIDTSHARRWVAELDGDLLIARLAGECQNVSKDRPDASGAAAASRPRPFRRGRSTPDPDQRTAG